MFIRRTLALVLAIIWLVSPSALVIAQDDAWKLHLDAGIEAFIKGDYADAETRISSALEEAEKFGSHDPRLATTLNALGEVYRAQGDYAAAEPLHKRALAIREKALGPDDAAVAQSLSNLAETYRAQGRIAEAEQLRKRASAIQERASAQVRLWDSYIAAGKAAYSRGDYAEAEKQNQAALNVSEGFGSQDPRLATSLNNLAVIYVAQGRYAVAESLHKRSLAIREKALGPEHPDAAQSLNNLAELYRTQGRYADAEPLYERSLAILEKTLGPEHPDVAASLNNLAALYQTPGGYAEAEPFYKRALAIWEKALGPEHPTVAESMENYASLLRQTGRDIKAAELETLAKAIRAKHAEEILAN